MEKRIKKTITLRLFLFGYLIRTVLVCLLITLLWMAQLFFWIDAGFVLPAYSGSDATLQAMELLPTMSADHFDPATLPPLCRWVLLDEQAVPGAPATEGQVLATNLTGTRLKTVLSLGSPPGYQQFYREVRLIDGTLCRLQYDFSTPYADPALRGVLPDFQIGMLVLLLCFLVAAVLWMTRRTARQLRRETRQLTEACHILAGQDLSVSLPSDVHIREFGETLQTLDSLRGELAHALKIQWDMEQQRTRRMAALTHDLKTPLTIIRGHAELAEEEPLSAAQQDSLQAIMRGVDRAERYLADLRAVCRMQTACSAPETFSAQSLVTSLAEAGQALCAPQRISFCLEDTLPADARLSARREELFRAVENLLANAARFTPPGGQVRLRWAAEQTSLHIAVTDTGPGFPAEILHHGGQMFATGDSSRSDGHQGLGLHVALLAAQAHGGQLLLRNSSSGACAELVLPCSLVLP